MRFQKFLQKFHLDIYHKFLLCIFIQLLSNFLCCCLFSDFSCNFVKFLQIFCSEDIFLRYQSDILKIFLLDSAQNIQCSSKDHLRLPPGTEIVQNIVSWFQILPEYAEYSDLFYSKINIRRFAGNFSS